tara:strand:+ start:1755 stop:2087 length:333 start_codon:yes stop_codon:yes gene_type:complete
MSEKFTPKIEIESSTLNFFNIDNFREFLIENKVSVTIVSFTVGYYLKDLIDSFYENIMFCEDNTKSLINYELCILNIKVKIGKFIISILKFLVSCLLVFYIARFLTDLVN